MERNVLKERLMNKDDKNRHFVLLIIDISKHGAKEMCHVKMAGPGFVNDVQSCTTLLAKLNAIYGITVSKTCNAQLSLEHTELPI
jgi:hypothetical protein